MNTFDSNAATVLAGPDDLLDFARRALRAVGVGERDASDMAGQILNSELAGHESHGFRRLSEYVERVRDGDVDPTTSGAIQSDTGSIVAIDGQAGFGHLVMRHATRVAIDRAKDHGITAVTVRNSGYVGRFVDFCEEAAENGVATLVVVNCSGAAQVAGPPGSLQPRLATNPIAGGVPRQSAPHLVVDMATTAVAMGRVSEWRDRGLPIPPDWVNDAGVLQFMSGVKGFALALLAEAFAGALTGAGTVPSASGEDRQGVLLIAMDVARFRPLSDFTSDVERFATYVREVPLEPEATPIRMPGESGATTARERRVSGMPIQPFTWSALNKLAQLLEIDPPRAGH
jgi:uncharacterized oxidoreductase